MCHVTGEINRAVSITSQQRFFGLLPVKGEVAFAGLYRQFKRATLIEAIVTGCGKERLTVSQTFIYVFPRPAIEIRQLPRFSVSD